MPYRSETVCSGEQLTVTCHTNGSAISWTVLVPYFSEGTTKNIFATDPDNVSETVLIGGIPFQFSKMLNSLLMSAVVVDAANVASDLNGTIVNCTIASDVMVTTTILVIGNGMVFVIILATMFCLVNSLNHTFYYFCYRHSHSKYFCNYY